MNAAPHRKIRSVAIRAAALLLALTCAFAPAASAQSGWNRSVESIAVTVNETNPSLWDVHGVLQVHLDEPSSVPYDLSLIVELLVNGTVVASNTHTVGADPGLNSCPDGAGCGGGCGSGTVDGQSAALLCIPDGACNPLCDCTCAFPPITSPFNGQTLQPEDEIMVLLRPAPGALPDIDESDDFKITTFDESPVFWDHQISNVELDPSSAGPDLWDITIDGLVEYSGLLPMADPSTGSVPLSFELELLVNGVPHSTHGIPFDPLPLASCACGQICGSYNGFPHACVLGYAFNCNCGWPWLSAIPAVPLLPDDELIVILRPVPGALPELPGFEEDDELHLACCPGPTGIDESVTVSGLAPRLEQNRPNPFDARTTIAFATAAAAQVTLEVFDVRGQRVRTLVDGQVEGSTTSRQVTWSGRTDSGTLAPAGIYFYRLTTDGRTETRKMVLTR